MSACTPCCFSAGSLAMAAWEGSVVSGQWSVVSGQWSVCQWSVVSGQWSVVRVRVRVRVSGQGQGEGEGEGERSHGSSRLHHRSEAARLRRAQPTERGAQEVERHLGLGLG